MTQPQVSTTKAALVAEYTRYGLSTADAETCAAERIASEARLAARVAAGLSRIPASVLVGDAYGNDTDDEDTDD